MKRILVQRFISKTKSTAINLLAITWGMSVLQNVKIHHFPLKTAVAVNTWAGATEPPPLIISPTYLLLTLNFIAWHCSSGRQPNFAALNRGRRLYSAGWPSRWALAHILVIIVLLKLAACGLLLSGTHVAMTTWRRRIELVLYLWRCIDVDAADDAVRRHDDGVVSRVITIIISFVDGVRAQRSTGGASDARCIRANPRQPAAGTVSLPVLRYLSVTDSPERSQAGLTLRSRHGSL